MTQTNIAAREAQYRAIHDAIKPKGKTMIDVAELYSLDGQVCLGEMKHLQELAATVPENGLVVEIGCFRGRSTASILSGLKPSVKMVCVDPWMKQGVHPYGYETAETLLAFRASTDRWKAQVTQVIGYPLEVAEWFDAPIDMLNVDAMKEYNQIAPIWRKWFPHVCRGGIVCSHDYQTDPAQEWHFPGVIQALAEIVQPHCEAHQHVDFTWSGRKL